MDNEKPSGQAPDKASNGRTMPGKTYHRGPVIYRGHMIPEDTTTGHLLASYGDTDWLHEDPWRVMRIQAEFVDGFGALAEIGPAVAVFGSARTDSADPSYAMAVNVGRRLAEEGVAVITGGGPGIMEAANRGAHDAGALNVGLNIALPHEQNGNPYITPSLSFKFHYFALRKMHFMMRAKALVAFPGGFGTLDELFEVLTLVQTGKAKPVPIVLFGTAFWKKLINFEALVEEGTISPQDLGLFLYTDDPQEAWDFIKGFYGL